MATVIVKAPHRHPMIPSFKETIERIKTLTGKQARPSSFTGLQVEDPSTITFEGTKENLDTLKKNQLNAYFA